MNLSRYGGSINLWIGQPQQLILFSDSHGNSISYSKKKKKQQTEDTNNSRKRKKADGVNVPSESQE